MRKSISKQLGVCAAALGAAAFALRMSFYGIGEDTKGLMPQTMGFSLAFWGLTAAMAVLAAVLTRKTEKAPGEPGVGGIPAAASVVMAAGLLLTVPGLRGMDGLSDLAAGLGLLAGGCLLGAGWMQSRNQKPYFLLPVAVCLFFAFLLISRYRSWSGNPQFELHMFDLGACVMLMLYAYHQAAACLNMSSHRARMVLGCLAGFFCLGALPHCEMPVLYLCSAVWVFTGLWTLPEKEESL